MTRLFSRLGMGSIITLSLAFVLFVSIETVWGAPIACTGSSSGSTGTCSTIANCNGTAETPSSRNSNGGPVSEVCPQDWICCIETASGGTKPPKDPPVIIDPVNPGQNPGTGDEGSYCAPIANDGIIRKGTCESSCAGTSLGITSACNTGLICCDNTPPNVGASCIGVNSSDTIPIVGKCAFQNQCTGTTDASATCNRGTICCFNSAGGPTTGGNAGASCAGGNGTCSTIANCTGFTPISDPVACSSGLICCPDGGPGVGGTGGTNTSTGTLECSDPTKYQKIAGVCFPKGTGLSEKSVIEIIAALISWLLAIFGFIALLGFIISGIQYLLSTGDEGMAETAKRNMKYSIVGIIVALSGWIIIKAVDALLNASSLI